MAETNPGQRSALVEVLWTQQGGWRNSLVWRAFGWAVLQIHFQGLFQVPLWDYWRSCPLDFHAFSFSALALILFGPRLILHIFMAFSGLAVLITTLSGQDSVIFFPAAEYPIMIGFPTVVSLLAIWMFWRERHNAAKAPDKPWLSPEAQSELEGAQLTAGRIWMFILMSFAGLHKINADFFNEEVGCTHAVMGITRKWWNTAEWNPIYDYILDTTPPLVAVGFEMLIPFICLLMPRVGVLTAVFFAANIALAAPTAFTATVVTLSFSFLPQGDWPAIKAGLWKHKHWILLVLAGVLTLSYSVYSGRRNWTQFAIHHVVLVWVGSGGLIALWSAHRDKRGQWAKAWQNFNFKEHLRQRWLWPKKDKVMRRGLVVFMALAMLNCLSPYFGGHFQYTFAMFSNLRVDDNRWNSYIFPRAMRLTEHDPFSHVREVDRIGQGPQTPPKDKHLIVPKLYSVRAFKTRLEFHRKHKLHINAKVRYQGEEGLFNDLAHNPAADTWVNTLPDTGWYRSALVLDGPQACKH